VGVILVHDGGWNVAGEVEFERDSIISRIQRTLECEAICFKFNNFP
jgi:hypothetical protein